MLLEQIYYDAFNFYYYLIVIFDFLQCSLIKKAILIQHAWGVVTLVKRTLITRLIPGPAPFIFSVDVKHWSNWNSIKDRKKWGFLFSLLKLCWSSTGCYKLFIVKEPIFCIFVCTQPSMFLYHVVSYCLFFCVSKILYLLSVLHI